MARQNIVQRMAVVNTAALLLALPCQAAGTVSGGDAQQPQTASTGSEKSKSVERTAGKTIARLHKMHAMFTDDLHKYVRNGLVDYARWKQSPERLQNYLNQLGKITQAEYQSLPEKEKLAIW